MKFLRRLLLWPLNKGLGLLVPRLTNRVKQAEQEFDSLDDGDTLWRLVQEFHQGGAFKGPRPIAFVYRYGKWLHRQRLYAEAIEIWRLALVCKNAILTERIECYLNLASCLLALDQAEQAETEALQPLERLLGDCAGEWPASDFSAEIMRFRLRNEEKIKLRLRAFRKRSSTPPELKQDFERRLIIAVVYGGLGRYRHGLKHAKIACSVAQTRAERVRGRVIEAHMFFGLKQFDLAEKSYQQAFQEAGNEESLAVRAYSAWASYLMWQGCFADCETVMERLSKFSPNHVVYLDSLYTYHLLHGRYDRARQVIKMSRALNPIEPYTSHCHQRVCDHGQISIELHAHYFGEPADLVLTRHLLEVLKKTQPIVPEFLQWLLSVEALLLAIEGKTEAALQQIGEVEASLEGLHDDALRELIYSFIAGTYLHLQEYEMARDWAEEYLNLCQSPVWSILMQEKLAVIYDGLEDAQQAEAIRRIVVNSGYPMMAVRTAQAKLSG